ncbi:sugar ABC transporter permease [Anaerocolumna aminovalerica]|jgi:raffinose/stachyose/melibiose transport system permease protein|uniref:Carbohydrate ABC transporter membrane protein 1, CUT1 family n=1 Tax=Anaerocolumna aminovalerica TaxID=1527 RepID=A0A1I5BKV9_9FIRM|nr:sugar ABC transporter permease [Anaerocolumna aminovalerica]MBU5330589.1 sugar ABC transporter permease [Anaerocolumna aminovalerica]MDU6264507.1 sugar ABC transporter permease [Anaerocolumna aminovalerica]SFN75229.1 carbohydrate ABC transporter membrane protein 1, CUT1 family [Anaerocolumna aminovalerica]
MEKVRRNKIAICLFMFPAVVLFATIIIIPIFMSSYYSLLDWDGITKGIFVGLDNFKELFTSKSAGFPKTIGNAMLLAVLSTFIQLPISLFFAIILGKGVKGEKFYVAVFFIPVLISTTVIGQLWLKIYNPDYGIVNAGLRFLGLDNLTHVWLGEQDTALFAVFIPILWQYVGYHMLLMYAGVKSISPDLREAAKIDGATEWGIARFITIPLLKPIIRICVIFAVTGSLKAFDLIYVLTNGGPAHASEVPSTLMVSMIFGRNRYGFGSAIAIMIIFLCFFFAVLIRKLFRTEEVD